MSTTTQLPVYEEVCVKTEQKLVGYRDLTMNEIMEEEAFSSNVPSTVGGTLKDTFTTIPFTPGTPGIVVLPSNPAPYEPPAIPIPGAIFLFAGALAVWFVFQQRKYTR